MAITPLGKGDGAVLPLALPFSAQLNRSTYWEWSVVLWGFPPLLRPHFLSHLFIRIKGFNGEGLHSAPRRSTDSWSSSISSNGVGSTRHNEAIILRLLKIREKNRKIFAILNSKLHWKTWSFQNLQTTLNHWPLRRKPVVACEWHSVFEIRHRKKNQ